MDHLYQNQYLCDKSHKYIIYMHPLMKHLLPYQNKKIQIITQATPPAGKPPNITGTLIYIDNKILKLQLHAEHEGSTSHGVYLLESLLGFIPLGEEDSAGCEKEKSPLSSVLSESLGKRVQLLVEGNTSTTTDGNIIGTVMEVTADFVKLQLDQTTATTTPLIGTYPLIQVVGVIDLTSDMSSKGKGKGKGSGGKGGKGGKGGQSTKGKITVQVTVNWLGSTSHPSEVNINYSKEGLVKTVSTINGVATFITEATGNLVIQGESVPGFVSPIKELKVTPKDPFVYEVLTYTSDFIPVTGITLSPATVSLLPTNTFQLTAKVLPLNANEQRVIWQSDNSDFATVDDNGLVTAIAAGTATISCKPIENSYLASAMVTITEIAEIVAPPAISAVPGQVIVLPDNVNVVLSNDAIVSLPVTWKYDGALVGSIFTIPPESPLPLYSLVGSLEQTLMTTCLDINVATGAPVAIPVSGLNLSVISTSIYVGNSISILPIIIPDNATTKDIAWSSLNSSVATVKDGTVNGIDPGITVIEATTIDGEFKAYCQVSVSAVPEIDLIYSVQNVYETREDVIINVENLVAARVDSKTLYYVKVEQSGSAPPLGSGTIYLTPDTTTFKLYPFTNFSLSGDYNKQYFVSMSIDPSYPKSDEQTLTTNFKIGSVVPFVNPDDIKIKLSMIGGYLENNPANITFILAREIDKPLETITWRDYVVNPEAPDPEKIFLDEVKLKGITNINGDVEWQTPAEKLKIGGYVLLEVTPEDYIDNLNLINPESADGELMKAVHLTRDCEITRNIINTAI